MVDGLDALFRRLGGDTIELDEGSKDGRGIYVVDWPDDDAEEGSNGLNDGSGRWMLVRSLSSSEEGEDTNKEPTAGKGRGVVQRGDEEREAVSGAGIGTDKVDGMDGERAKPRGGQSDVVEAVAVKNFKYSS